MALGQVRGKITLLTGIALVVVVYAFARLPDVSSRDRDAMASRFHFDRSPMLEAAHGPYRSIREVHPSLKRIAAWISSVGAGVALADLDADGLSNDSCRVEPRTDQVIVAPAPGTGNRYAPFTLDPSPIPYDPSYMAPTGCLMADLNEDGLMDLVVYYWGRTPVAFLRNAGTPGVKTALKASDFTPVDLVPTGERWYTNAAFVADIDGDGHLDIVVGNYFKDGAHTIDPNGTGVESMHNTKSKAFNGGSKRVLLWESASAAPSPMVHFKDAPDVFSAEVLHGWTLAAGAADLDGDLLPEMYFAHDFGPDRLLHNRSTPGHPKFAVVEGKRTLGTPASCVLGHDSFKGMGVDFGDVNGDGIPDIYVSNIADQWALQESHFLWLSTGKPELMKSGVAPYVNASEELGLSRSGWGWDARIVDFDNDTVPEALQATGFLNGKINRWPELQALGTGNDRMMEDPNNWPGFKAGDDVSGHSHLAFFVRLQNGRYADVAQEIGMGDDMVSRGLAIADVDGDGRLDFAVANQWQESYFFHNQSPQVGTYLGLHLLLPLRHHEMQERDGHPGADTPGRAAIGASVMVTLAETGRTLVAQLDGGSGHSGKRSPDIHLGLGAHAAETPVKVDVHWRDPGGQVRQTTLNLKPGWHTVVLPW